MKKATRFTAAAVLVCAAIFALLCVLRAPRENKVYWNSDAPYHAMLTVQSYRETPISTHKFVPLVTLGDASDKWVDWGSTLPDASGNFYYTSFSAAQFIAPYLVLRLLHLPVTLQTLYAFNCLLYAACAALTALVLTRLLRGKLPTWFVVVCAALLYLCPPEIQHAQGVIYWAQSLFQLVFLLQLWLFVHLPDSKGKWRQIAFFALCVAAPFIEWTGYVSNVGFVLAQAVRCWQSAPKGGRAKALLGKRMLCFAGAGALCTLASFAIFCAHYLTVLDADKFFKTLYDRFFTRSVIAGATQLTDLLARYGRGFGALLLLAGVLLLAVLCLRGARAALARFLATSAPFWVAAAFPLFENFLLRGHAIAYTYDTIKLVFVPLALVLSCMAALYVAYPARARGLLCGSVCAVGLACAVMIAQYNFLPNSYHWQVDYLDENAALAQHINKTYPAPTTLLANEDFAQRGWENLLFHRNIFEWRTYDQLLQRAANDSKRFVVVLEGDEEPDIASIYRFTGYWVYDGRALETQYYAWNEGEAVAMEHALPQLSA